MSINWLVHLHGVPIYIYIYKLLGIDRSLHYYVFKYIWPLLTRRYTDLPCYEQFLLYTHLDTELGNNRTFPSGSKMILFILGYNSTQFARTGENIYT